MRGHRRTPATVILLVVASALFAAACGPGDDLAPHSIAVLRSVPDDGQAALIEELRRHGWHHGRDVIVYPRDPTQVFDDVDVARDALRRWHAERPLRLVIALSTPHAQMAITELPDVPMLVITNDPHASGLVDDTASPGGSVTGVAFWTPADRTVALASQLLGDVELLGYLWPEDDDAVPSHRGAAVEAADHQGIEAVDASFRDGDVASLEAAVAQLSDAGVAAVWLATASGTVWMRPQIELALRAHGLPAIANLDLARFPVVTVTPDSESVYRQVGRQAARVLDGTPISSIPVERPRRFIVIINRTQAQALGLPDLEPTLLRQADLVR